MRITLIYNHPIENTVIILGRIIKMQHKLVALSELAKGASGIVQKIDEDLLPHNIELEPGELERRLLEIGIIEGTTVKVLHFGLINHDPIALQIDENGTSIAIRKNEAAIVLVTPIDN